MTADPRAQLADRYEITAELRHDDHSTTWLGRHKTLGRDVSITVLRASSPTERNVLGLIAADSRILGAVKHDHIVPVLDTRWLSTDELAIVRPRVRGTTIRSLVTGAGTLSPKRTEELLREIGGTLEWASRNGVVHRYLSPDSVCVQQGSKKVLLSFGPPAILEEGFEEKIPEGAEPRSSPRMLKHCSDSNTLAWLGWTMLTGHEPTGSEGSMRHLRPDVPPPMAEAIDEGLRCDGQTRIMPLASFLARLGGSGSSPRAAGLAVPVAATTAAPILNRPSPAVAAEPVSRRGSGLKVAMAVLVIAALALGAWVVMQNRGGDDRVAGVKRDTGNTAAGDVSVNAPPAGPSVLTDGAQGRIQQQPGVGAPPATAPAAATPAPVVPPAGTTAPPPPVASSGDPCTSPTPADQRRCLDSRIAENDRGLNATYGALTRALAARDPAALAALRDRQRAWLQERDAACRGAGSGDLWAEERARCLAAQSAARERELSTELSRLP